MKVKSYNTHTEIIRCTKQKLSKMSKYISEDFYKDLLSFATPEMLITIIQENGWSDLIHKKLAPKRTRRKKTWAYTGHLSPFEKKFPINRFGTTIQNFLRYQSTELYFSQVDVMKILSQYLEQNCIQDPNDIHSFILDDTLQNILPGVETATLAKLKYAIRVQFPICI